MVERVTTGMVSLIVEGLCAMMSSEKEMGKCWKGEQDGGVGGGQGAREIDNGRLQYVGFRSTCLRGAPIVRAPRRLIRRGSLVAAG